jgi:hypothetical protein
MRSLPFLIAVLSLSGCGEAVRDDHFANDVDPPPLPEAEVRTAAVPVRVGESGPSFDACAATGTTRNIEPAKGETLLVRAAPFDTAEASGTVAAGARFFVCTRSHDQRWLGIVWHEGEGASEACGVSSPSVSRRGYDGPCRSGWAPAAFVKLIAG